MAPSSGIPLASTTGERFIPCFPRSTGLLPAFSPPQGALVMQSRPQLYVGKIEPNHPIVSVEHHLLELVHHSGVDPLLAPASEGGRRATLLGDSLVGAEPKTRTCPSFSKSTLSGMRGL